MSCGDTMTSAAEAVVAEPTQALAVAEEVVKGKRRRWGRRAILGRLPDGCFSVTQRVAVLRNRLIRALEVADRKLDITAECHIQTILRHEAVSQLCLRQLRQDWQMMSPEIRLAYLRATSRESDLRDRAVRELNLNRSERDTLIAQLYGPRPAIGEVER